MLHAAGVVSVPFVPAGLSPGDTYQIAFVTAGATDAIDPDIDFYDSFVADQAALIGAITETWAIEWSAVVFRTPLRRTQYPTREFQGRSICWMAH